MNRVVLSEDGREVLITNPERPGWKVQLRSRRPEGFRPEDLWNAQEFAPAETMKPGQRTVTRRIVVGPFAVYLHLLTGPPTWPLPLMSMKRPDGRCRLLVGWLRCAVAVSVSRKEEDE